MFLLLPSLRIDPIGSNAILVLLGCRSQINNLHFISPRLRFLFQRAHLKPVIPRRLCYYRYRLWSSCPIRAVYFSELLVVRIKQQDHNVYAFLLYDQMQVLI